MAEYLERETLMNAMDNLCNRVCDYSPAQRHFMCGCCPLGSAFELVEEFPVENVQPVEWIPVTERLPDFEGMCLCMRKSYSKANFRHQEIMYFDYDEQAFCSNADGIFVADGNVTHWMPLPKPPKESDDG